MCVTPIGGRCFTAFAAQLSWTEAQTFCIANGYQSLTSIQNAQENTLIGYCFNWFFEKLIIPKCDCQNVKVVTNNEVALAFLVIWFFETVTKIKSMKIVDQFQFRHWCAIQHCKMTCGSAVSELVNMAALIGQMAVNLPINNGHQVNHRTLGPHVSKCAERVTMLHATWANGLQRPVTDACHSYVRMILIVLWLKQMI